MHNIANKNILIVKYGALGDVVRTSFILGGLKVNYPYSRIYWLTDNSTIDLLRFNPYISYLITDSLNYGILCETYFDLVISLDDELEILKRLTNIKYADIIGSFLDNEGNPTYDERSSLWFDMGRISKYGLHTADQLKKNNFLTHKEILEKMLAIRISDPLFYNSRVIEDEMQSFFDIDYFNIGINSGSGERWPSKEMPLIETISLIKSLLFVRIDNKPIKIYLLGGISEEKRHRYILENVINPNLINTGNRNSLLEFAAIIKHLSYSICSDSLALHLCIANKIPNLSYFTPTSAAEISTFGTGVKLTSTSDDYCTYMKHADNSSITAERIINLMRKHLTELGLNYHR